jgi:hypothetical protein
VAPARSRGASSSPAWSMYDRSGAPSRRGVGTVITATSKSSTPSSVVTARYRPVASAAATVDSEMSSTYERPAVSASIRTASRS